VNALLNFAKEKSWGVKLVGGFVSNNQVRSLRCKGCDSTSKLVVGSNHNPNLALWGCSGHKCKHVLIRMNFEPQSLTEIVPLEEPANSIQVSETFAVKLTQ
jgi:hypothetical protein